MIERVIFTLWITRAISVAPTWLRSVSGPISRPAPALDQGRDEDQTLAMKSFVRKVGAYSERAVLTLFPDVMPSSLDAAYSLTTSNASATTTR